MPEPYRLAALGLSLLVILLDQLSKFWVLHTLVLHQPTPFIDGLINGTLTYNSGAAFSFLSQASGWQRPFFIGLTLLISSGIVVWMWRLKAHEKTTLFALGLILGGACGNLIDRIILGKVVDFIDFYVKNWHWPAFNLADSAISLGVIILLSLSFFEHRKHT